MRKILPSFPLIVITVMILFLSPGLLRGQDKPAEENLKFWKEYHASVNDSMRIEKLAKRAYLCLDKYNDWETADSLGEMAVSLAERSFRPSLRLLAYNLFLESVDIRKVIKRARDIAGKAVSLCTVVNDQPSEWRTYKNMVAVSLASYNYDEALKWSYKALPVASLVGDEAMKAESYLCIGASLEAKSQAIEALRSYITASNLAERSLNYSLLRKCYSRISSFYNLNKIYENATYYKLKERDLLVSSIPVDSTALMWILCDLQSIVVNTTTGELDDKSARDIINYGIRNGNERLRDYEFALYRTHLINNSQIGALEELYTRSYPSEFRKLRSTNPSLWYRLKAYFNENENKPDSASYYLALAEKTIRLDPNRVSQSNFFKRYGQFLLRHGRDKEAEEKFKTSYALAKEAGYTDYMLLASKELEQLYSGKRDWGQAYYYLSLNQVLADSVRNLSKKEEMLKQEINYEALQRQIAAEREEQETVRRHNIQYTAITIGTLVLFLILMLIGSFKVPAWSIKVLGFFSFILLFEFIVLITDHTINRITHGEPWKILLIKVILIGFLLPLHEWSEKRLTEYLLRHKLVDINRLPMYRLYKRSLHQHKVSTVKTENDTGAGE